MTTSQHIRLDLRAATEVPKWAFHFYVRHWILIAGISALPSIERFILLFFHPEWSETTLVSLELFVESLRFLLLWLIIRLAISKDTRLAVLSRGEKWRRVKSFVSLRWFNLVFQMILMVIATLIFDVFLEKIVGLLVPEHNRSSYLAVLLFVKNPTVIAWFMVWMVGIPRQMMLYSTEASRNADYVNLV